MERRVKPHRRVEQGRLLKEKERWADYEGRSLSKACRGKDGQVTLSGSGRGKSPTEGQNRHQGTRKGNPVPKVENEK